MSKYEVSPSVLVKCASSFLATSLAVVGLATTGITTQAQDHVKGGAVASLRSFPKASAARRDFLSESVSTEVDNNHNWGGIEELNVPKTESPEEKAVREKKEQEDAARKQQEEQAQAASRSAVREALPQSQPSRVLIYQLRLPVVKWRNLPCNFRECLMCGVALPLQVGIALVSPVMCSGSSV